MRSLQPVGGKDSFARFEYVQHRRACSSGLYSPLLHIARMTGSGAATRFCKMQKLGFPLRYFRLDAFFR
ncbi:hypothetical protein C8Z91_02965 [Paenibacillus elgii]|uniref:Uncharacterized protein n=1 Tax=Paenibacillus elgii TaxID=189691 RepID=A0A2T6G9I7_9BACL|nr:hypothetical protein [Paenibacillus elgii]PUA40805.1 hypothetical protein C8Z91_02965 [Paenibacillus elgii]